jgi:TPR repeat protein
VQQDYAKAKQLWEQAAAQGNAQAQYNLGLLYYNGQGVPQDYTKAREWFEKAAAQGLAQAQQSLKAREWYEQAAAQGFPQSQQELKAQLALGWLYDRGVQYANGQGVPQDNVRAHMWYSLAEAHVIGVQQRWASDARDYVASRMTPAQIAEAQRLAQQCQLQQFKGC